MNKRCLGKKCHYVTKVSHSTFHLSHMVTSIQHLNIMQKKAIENQIIKKIKQNQSKERQKKQVKSVASSLMTFEKITCRELKK